VRSVDRHEIGDTGNTSRRFVAGFKNQSVAAVAPPRAARFVPGADAPASMTRVAEQGGKSSVTIKMRPAQPVDRAVARNQCGAAAVANQGVVLLLTFGRSDPWEPLVSTQR
jgi:hypothetical protein